MKPKHLLVLSFTFLLVGFGFSQQSEAAVAVAQSAYGVNNFGGSSNTSSFTSNTTAGDTSVVLLQWYNYPGDPASTLTSVTDSQGNAYTIIPGTVNQIVPVNYPFIATAIAYAAGIQGGPDTVSGNWDQNTGGSFVTIYETSPSTLDQSTKGTGSGPNPIAGALTTAADGEAVFSTIMGDQIAGFFPEYAPPSGWVQGQSTGGGSAIEATAYLLQASAGTAAIGYAQSTASKYTISAASFAPTGSSGGGSQPPASDTTAPTISGVSSGSVTSSGTTITWSTNESSDSQIEYGLTTSYGNSTALNSSMVSSHSASLSSLTANTQYHYRVKSRDAAGNLATGSDNTFTTSAASGGGTITTGTNFYIAQNTVGSADASSCSNAQSISWLNTSGNWASSGTGKIIPGSTVHLCGTISTTVSIQGSGSSGNPITVFFESGAKLSRPFWGVDGAAAINLASKSNIVIDGGSNGVIENTANGDQLANGQPSYGMNLTSCSNVEVKNMSIRNIFIHTYNVNNIVPAYSTRGIYAENCNNFSIHDNTISDAYVGVYDLANGASLSNHNIYGNTLRNTSTALIPSLGGSASDALNTVNVYDNDITMGLNWFDTPDANHIDGIHAWTSPGRTTNLKIYGNYIHGDPSTDCTGYIFLEGNFTSPLIYNNVLVGTGNHPTGGYISIGSNTDTFNIFNNTIVGLGTSNLGGIGIGMYGGTGAAVIAKLRNNILSSLFIGIYDSDSPSPNTNVTFDSDYNLFYNVGSVAWRVSHDATLAAWQASSGGQDPHSLTSNPALASIYVLPSNSPAVNAGTNLSSYFATDKDGNARSGTWDIGAYEYAGAVTPPPVTSVSDIYIAQSAGGSADASSCANAKPASFFNSSSNWGSGASQIGPGKTVHLCGTISTAISVQASGASGNPITVFFEPGAKMSAPAFAASGALVIHSKNYITVDGGTNGVMENTANGTNLSNHIDTTMIDVDTADHITVQNLDFRNIYVRTAGTEQYGYGTAVSFTNTVTNILAAHNTVDDAYIGIGVSYGGGSSNIRFSYNTMTNTNWGLRAGDRTSASSLDTLTIDHNNASQFANWDDSLSNSFHHNGFYGWAESGGMLRNVKIYDNTFGPAWGIHTTGGVFMSGDFGSTQVYNNLFLDNANDAPSNGLISLWPHSGAGTGYQVYNNTIIGGGVGRGVYLTGGNGTGVTTFTVKNNLIYDVGTAIAQFNPESSTMVADYNLGNSLKPSEEYYVAGFLSPAQWKAMGFDAHGTSGAPNLSGSYVPQSGSAAIDTGTSLSSVFTDDIAGTSRPQNSAWDIGAYEYAGAATPPPVTSVSDIYISQSGAGSGDASSCANAKTASFFDTAANWGSGASQIGPGKTVHLCGTISAPLSVKASGASGSPITILFEPNAKLSAATWTSPSISVIDASYIIVDGGTNGIIEATNNGASLANHNSITGVDISDSQHSEFKNLTIQNLYTRTQNSTDKNDATGLVVDLTNSDGASAFTSIHDNTINWAGTGIYWGFDTGSNSLIYHNTIRNISTGIIYGSKNSNSTFTNVDIYGNDISDAYQWDEPSDYFHHDGIHFWNYGPSGTGLKVHDNYVHGNWGAFATAELYFEGTSANYLVYNNVLATGIRHMYTKLAGPGRVYNNAFYGGGFALDSLTGNVVDFKNNIMYQTDGMGYNGNAGTNPTVTSANNLSTNPLFVNAAGGDFHLQASSPAVNAGANLSSYFTTDKDGNTRGSSWDIGPYEYSGSGGGGTTPPPSTFTLTVTKSGSGSGTLTSSVGGISCGSTCASSALTSGTSVTVTAVSASGSAFLGWGGACSGTGSCVVSLTSDSLVSAVFGLSAVPDTTAPTVSITSPAAGTISGSVTLAASASDNIGVVGVQFKLDGANLGSELTTAPYSGSWNTVGVSNGSHTLTAVARDAAGNTKTSSTRTVTVSNTLPTFTLSVVKAGSGSGTVTSNTGGISCGSTCAVSINSGTSVTLTASPSNGSTFLGWSSCSGTGTCVKTISSATTVTATFGLAADTSAPSTPTGLTPSSVTQTGVTLSWLAAVDNVGVTGYKIFKNGVQIASPTTNSYAITGLSANTLYTFTVSAYDAAGNTSLLSLPLSVTTAAIPVPTYALSASKSGTGTGTITGNGLNCGSTCSVSITSGTTVTLTATPSSDSTFDGWSGACTNASGACITTVISAKSVAAIFTLIPVVTPPASGGGGGGSSGGTVTSSSGGGGGSVVVVSSPTGIFTPTVTQAPATTPVAPVSCTTSSGSFTRSLTVGATGSDVKALQIFLNARGFTVSSSGPGSKGNESTYFGPATTNAVSRFQAANGISPASGLFGPITTAKVNSLLGGSASCSASTPAPVTTTTGSIPAFTRSLTIGATGIDVKYLQMFLNTHGFEVSLSGAGSPNNETTTFGPATTKALAKFQASKGISPAVGYFGPITMGVVNKQR